jgi:hypothetical protein
MALYFYQANKFVNINKQMEVREELGLPERETGQKVGKRGLDRGTRSGNRCCRKRGDPCIAMDRKAGVYWNTG